ncbi:MAG: twin-arginine translocation signal domain-containing protein [Candidatus Hydrogenedentota bacterium]|nr:MAG: twin-arginine translocation signal domain-containing protein [Candidatus Hydrogenedentota bacterium]
MPDNPPVTGLTRRGFLKASLATSAAVAAVSCGGGAERPVAKPSGDRVVMAENSAPPEKDVPNNILSACPYCGVGCGTMIQTEKGKIVGMKPDPKHPTNKGLQCIKGLTSNEAIYVDRLTKPLIRKDYSDPLRGHISGTKGRFDDSVFREATWEEAEELIVEQIAGIVKKFGGNAVGLYGSGQLPVEGQWLENLFMKGVLGSNTIEANARMCMTSAVTGYFKSLGSDTPPTAYEDIELADMVTHWGHNARGAHPIVFWRIADHKARTGIPTLVVDPRRTGTVQGYEEIDPKSSYHFATINGDIAIHNAIAHVLLTKHEEAVAWDFLKKYTTGWKEYVKACKERYSPEAVQEITMIDPDYLREVAARWAEASIKGRKNGKGGVLTFWGIGYNQHIHGQNNTVSLINLMALSGNIGRPGCGPFSMTGQPNAMGERLTGGLTGRLPFNQGLKNEKWRAHIAQAWRIPRERLDQVASSSNPGYAVGMMERALKGDVKAFFLIYATHIDLPDQNNLVRPALTKTFNVAQEIYRHAPNNLYADVILPAATWGEWVGGTYIQSERRFYVCDGTANPIPGTKPDIDMVIDKGKAIAKALGLDGDKIFPYKKRPDGFYDPEDIFRDFVRASKGSDADLTGMLEVEERDGISLYEQIRRHRGIQWPAPTYEIAKQGGTKRRYMNQEGPWVTKPYGAFRHKDGKLHIHLCEQDYSNRKELTAELMRMGAEKDFYAIDHIALLKEARDKGLTPELPDEEYRGKPWQEIPKDKYPYWIGLGVVYEHFHTSKTIRSGTTRRLVPEQYVEMHPEDAAALGIRDGDWVRIITRRGSYEARASIGLDSKVRPARNTVPRGYMFSPWNLSVADSADPAKNRWLVNAVSHRAFDPVSGQVDFKKLACRIEKV